MHDFFSRVSNLHYGPNTASHSQEQISSYFTFFAALCRRFWWHCYETATLTLRWHTSCITAYIPEVLFALWIAVLRFSLAASTWPVVSPKQKVAESFCLIIFNVLGVPNPLLLIKLCFHNCILRLVQWKPTLTHAHTRAHNHSHKSTCGPVCLFTQQFFN